VVWVGEEEFATWAKYRTTIEPCQVISDSKESRFLSVGPIVQNLPESIDAHHLLMN